jgi:hypothetical protein
MSVASLMVRRLLFAGRLNSQCNFRSGLLGRRQGLSTGKPLNNLDPAFDVASKIVRNMTDMQMTKMLHIYCGGNFVNFFGQVSCVIWLL